MFPNNRFPHLLTKKHTLTHMKAGPRFRLQKKKKKKKGAKSRDLFRFIVKRVEGP